MSIDDPDDANDKTLAAYNRHVAEYVADNKKTVESSLRECIDEALKLIPQGSRILEIGSAYGRDADYMESLGYDVERTDAADGFLRLLAAQGRKARKLNVLTDDLGTGYDMIFAQAVFLHFTPKQLSSVLRKCFRALKTGGVLAFSVKKGDGARWTDNYSWSTGKVKARRYFQFWQSAAIRKITEEAGFRSVSVDERKGSRADWLHVTALRR